MIDLIKTELEQLSDKHIAVHSSRYFKTGPGQYGEGDQFRGIRVPELRRLSRKYKKIPINNVVQLLHSSYHEDRLLSLFILVFQYQSGNEILQEEIFDLYLANTKLINNWDLVDSSARQIVGARLYKKNTDLLREMARSDLLWDRRIAIIATAYFIGKNEFDDTLTIARILLNDEHDLIHKAVGWMLREVGNRKKEIEIGFLKLNYKKMPRTMLRYAIEKFPVEERQAYLKGNV